MCPESMARQSRTVPSAQEIRAKYSLVDACFILRRCYIYLYLLWRNTLTHLWSGGSEWNTLAHECARTLGSLWFFGHQEPSQRQRALNWIANSDAPETWGDDACAIHGASTSGRMQFENLARHSRCIWRFVKMSVPGFVDKSQFHACRLMFAFKKHDLPWWRENVEILRYLWKSF